MQAKMNSLYSTNKYTGEFCCRETEKEFINSSWPVLYGRLFIAILLSSITYFFASCIPRPEVNPEYRALMKPLTRAVAVFILSIAFVIKKNKSYPLTLRIMLVLAEIFIGLLESADQYFYLKSINKFYDIGTSYLVFYILIFYLIIPNRLKLTVLTSLGISITFITVIYLSGVAAYSDLLTTAIYFIITNCLGYGILLTTNKSKREEYYYGIQLKQEIANRKEAEQEALAAKLRAEEGDKAKSRFLAIMNHEMRTPLNIILGGMQILNNNDLSEENAELMSIIRNSGEMLKVLIQNVLDFTNIQKKKLHIREEKFSLPQMIDEIGKIYSRISEEKGLEFSISKNCSSVEYVEGDPMSLRQILTNLLNNAVKFTNRGSVCLSIDPLEKEKHTTILRFSVSDTGIGISEELFDDILQPFIQVEQSATRNYNGSGLGLTICSELLNAMGSSLEITSKEGTGSTFSFSLPLPLSAAEELHAKELAVLDSYRILLIDDIDANLTIVGRLLESLNQEIVYARGSRQGINEGLMNTFDAVIADLHMPGMNGMKTIRQIKVTQPDISAFLMTADTREEVYAEYREAGFTDFIPKPVDISQLKNALIKIRSNKIINNNMTGSDNHKEIVDKVFISELRNELGDDIFMDVIKSCIKTLKKDTAVITNIDSNDDRQDLIHQLKGVAGNYRLLRLWELLNDYKSDISLFDNRQLKDVLEESITALNDVITPLLQ